MRRRLTVCIATAKFEVEVRVETIYANSNKKPVIVSVLS